MQEGARGMRLAIAGYERVMEGADMRASVLTLAAGECVPWHYHSAITDSFGALMDVAADLLIRANRYRGIAAPRHR
jgi:hypothetical protein